MKRIKTIITCILTIMLNSNFLFADFFVQKEFVSGNVLQTEIVNQIFMNINLYKKEKGIWIKPYISNGSFKLGTNTDGFNSSYIKNNLNLMLIGLDIPVKINCLVSFYAGLDNSNQRYAFNSDSELTNDISEQNGGFFGLAWMIIKENYYFGLTANLIYNNISPTIGQYYYNLNRSSDIWTIATKIGYNIKLGEKWILEPNLTLILGMINISNIEPPNSEDIAVFEPQLKIKYDLFKNWQVYGMLEGVVQINNNKNLIMYQHDEFYDERYALEYDTSLRYGKVCIGINNDFIGKYLGISGEITTRILTESLDFGISLGVKYNFLCVNERKITSFDRKKKEEQKKIEKEVRARLAAEENRIEKEKKARIEEEKRLKKEEQEKQKELEKERLRKEKEEQERKRQLEIERKIQENYN